MLSEKENARIYWIARIERKENNYMGVWPKDYTRYVLEDIEKYKNTRKIKKSGIIERLIIKRISPKKLHPNPDDEFSIDSVGPNFSIVSKYVEEARLLEARDMTIFEEPIIVEKMAPDGYMLINGHHRWFAAVRMNIKKLHINITNLVHEADITRMLESSNNNKRVAFDLDEVLLATTENSCETVTEKIQSKQIKERLKKGVPDVIKALQNRGYDVWVYTAGYFTEDYIRAIFKLYKLEVSGIINGVNPEKKNNSDEVKRTRERMAKKYKTVLNIDNESVVRINSENKDYNQYSITKNEAEWSREVVNIIERENM